MANHSELQAVQPLLSGYGPASQDLRLQVAQPETQVAARDGNRSPSSGSDGDSGDNRSSARSAAAAEPENGDVAREFGLDGTAGPSSGSGGQDGGDDQEEKRGRGNWRHGVPARWTDEEDLELLRIINSQMVWGFADIAAELNRRFPNNRDRTEAAVRQRRKNLEGKGITLANLEAKCKPRERSDKGGKDDGSDGAAGGATGTAAA